MLNLTKLKFFYDYMSKQDAIQREGNMYKLTSKVYVAKASNDAYRQGLEDGAIIALKMTAWWYDNEQYVGQQRPDGEGHTTLEQSIARIKKIIHEELK